MIKYVFLFAKLIFVYRLMTTPVGVTRHTGVSSRRYKGVETGRVWNLPDDVIGLVYQCTFFLSSIFFPYHNQIKIEKIPIGMRWSIPIPPFFLSIVFHGVFDTLFLVYIVQASFLFTRSSKVFHHLQHDICRSSYIVAKLQIVRA